ncbi:MAG: riboflavin synthase [candidate division KSB1 bacterium]|nr:riboflavin synthase [candidate division KSB1 bacterium]
MFTGLIREVGTVASLRFEAKGAELTIQCRTILDGLRVGDSVAVDGACLTVARTAPQGFVADVVAETLERTIIRRYTPGTPVNLEPALRLGEPLGGHMVLGHVDGVAEILEFVPEGEGRRMWLRAPAHLRRYIAEKGSVAINGVSLTVASVRGGDFSVALIPFTLQQTNLGRLVPGAQVNLEVDVIARYVERLVQFRAAMGNGITWERLEELGFAASGSLGS